MAMTEASAKLAHENEIDPLVLRTRVSGRNLRGATLGDCLAPQGTLLVFVRHFGCTFCRDMVQRIRSCLKSGVDVVFVHQGSIREGEEFFTKRWPEAAAIADPSLLLFRSFGIQRGSLKELVSPSVLISGMKGILNGRGVGLLMGDPLMMPGLFLIRGTRLLWHYDFKDIADFPVDLPATIGKNLET